MRARSAASSCVIHCFPCRDSPRSSSTVASQTGADQAAGMRVERWVVGEGGGRCSARTSGMGSSSSRQRRRAGTATSANASRNRPTRSRVAASPTRSRGVTRAAARRPLRRSRSPTPRSSVSRLWRQVTRSRRCSTASSRSPIAADVGQRREQPVPQQAAAHGREGLVEHPQQRPTPLAAHGNQQFEIPACGLIEVQAIAAALHLREPQVFEPGAMRLFQVRQQGGDGREAHRERRAGGAVVVGACP